MKYLFILMIIILAIQARGQDCPIPTWKVVHTANQKYDYCLSPEKCRDNFDLTEMEEV